MDRIKINTVFGTLFAQVSSDPTYPGIFICLEQDINGELHETQLALIEATPDNPSDGAHTLRAMIWGDADLEDSTKEIHYLTSGDNADEFITRVEVSKLKSAGVTMKQIEDELEYRGNTGIEAPEPGSVTCGWDDDLCRYTTARLEEIRAAW